MGLSSQAPAISATVPVLEKLNEGCFMENQSKVISLIDLVSYQDGAVVSMTLIEKKTGTVTRFAFDKGEALSEHTAPFDAMVHVLDGAAGISIAGKPFEVRQGEMLIMPADKPHALRAVEKFKMMRTMIRS